jgi:CO/xanthine dehydrogenase Mo-binding subunit
MVSCAHPRRTAPLAARGAPRRFAAAARIDPVEFRTARLSDPRALDVINQASRVFGWDRRPSPNPQAQRGGVLVGRGFAYMRYKQAENYVALAMEVAVDRGTGRVAVRRVVCAHDCGLVVNPDALKNQVEVQPSICRLPVLLPAYVLKFWYPCQPVF